MKITTYKVKESDKVNPKKFVLWLIIVAIIMFFAGLTSAYLVRKAEGNWYNFKLPSQFIYSTIAIILSSVTLWWTKKYVKNDEFNFIKVGLFITLMLGILFCYFQYSGWKSMNMNNLYFTDDVNTLSGITI